MIFVPIDHHRFFVSLFMQRSPKPRDSTISRFAAVDDREVITHLRGRGFLKPCGPMLVIHIQAISNTGLHTNIHKVKVPKTIRIVRVMQKAVEVEVLKYVWSFIRKVEITGSEVNSKVSLVEVACWRLLLRRCLLGWTTSGNIVARLLVSERSRVHRRDRRGWLRGCTCGIGVGGWGSGVFLASSALLWCVLSVNAGLVVDNTNEKLRCARRTFLFASFLPLGAAFGACDGVGGPPAP